MEQSLMTRASGAVTRLGRTAAEVWPRPSSIGVQIDGRMVRCVQVERIGGAMRLKAAMSVPRRCNGQTLSAGEAWELAGAMRRQGFAKAGLVLAATEAAVCAPLELPPSGSGAPLEQIARMEVARAQRLEAGAFELAMWNLPGPERGGGTAATHVLAAACAHDKAEATVAPFDGSGLQVAGLDLAAWGLARGCGAWARGMTGLAGVLDVGWDRALIVMLACGKAEDGGGQIVYERSLPEHGLSKLYARLESEHEMSAGLADVVLGHAGKKAEEQPPGLTQKVRNARGAVTEFLDSLLPEVEQSLAYAAGRFSPRALGGVFLTGGCGKVEGLADRLAGQVGVEVRMTRPADTLEFGAEMEWAALDSELVLATGLAMPAARVAGVGLGFGSAGARGVAA